MESFCTAAGLRHHVPKPLLFRRLSTQPKPCLPPSIPLCSRPTTFPILASSSSSRRSSPPPSPTPLHSLLKPLCVTFLASASLLLLSGFRKSHLPLSLAAAPPAQSDTRQSDSSGSTETALTEDEKERILEEYLDACPDDTKSLRALMELKIKAQKFQDAISIIDRLILLDSDNTELHLLKAHLQSHAGDIESAKIGFEELLDKDPFLVEAFHGLVMAAGKYSGAEEGKVELDNIVKRIEVSIEKCKKEKRKEDLRDFKLLMAQIRVMEGKYDDALGVYKELVKEEPRDFRPYLCQGIIYSVLQKKNEAKKQFEKYRRLVPRGHPYAQYFDENVLAMKVFGQMEENKKENKENALRR